MNYLCSKFNSPVASRSPFSPLEWKCQFFHRFYSSWCHQAWYRWASPVRTCSHWLPALLCHLLRNSDYFPRILSEIPRNRNFKKIICIICIWGDERKKIVIAYLHIFQVDFQWNLIFCLCPVDEGTHRHVKRLSLTCLHWTVEIFLAFCDGQSSQTQHWLLISVKDVERKRKRRKDGT